jgi:hypothetical protein
MFTHLCSKSFSVQLMSESTPSSNLDTDMQLAKDSAALLVQEIKEQVAETAAGTLVANSRAYVLLIMKYESKKGLISFPFRKQVCFPLIFPLFKNHVAFIVHVDLFKETKHIFIGSELWVLFLYIYTDMSCMVMSSTLIQGYWQVMAYLGSTGTWKMIWQEDFDL